jgi:hypothetical protein
VILVCRFDSDLPNAGSGVTLLNLGLGKDGPVLDCTCASCIREDGSLFEYKDGTLGCSAGLPLVQKVMQHLGLILGSPSRDPTPAQFLAFLLSICYNVRASVDFEPFSRPCEYGNFEIKRDIRFCCRGLAPGLAPIIAFLQGHHPRLGHASKVSFLQNLRVVYPILQTNLKSKGLLDLILI